MFQYLAALSSGLSLLALRANGQTTEAICLSSFSWMNNARGQNPCLVAAYLEGACLPDGQWSVSALTSADTSYANLKADQASPCTCSSVSFNLLSACAFCQGFDLLVWGDWIDNCSTSLVSNGQYPHAIPPGTSVPSWSYQIVIDRLNITEAQSVAAEHAPDSVAPGASSTASTSSSTSSIATTSSSTESEDSSSSSTSASSTTSNTATDTATAAAKSSDHTGAIVGGVVGGVAAVVIALLGAYFLYKRSQRTPYTLPTTTPAQYDNPHAPLTGPVSPQPSTVPYASTPGSLASDTPQMRFYNPDDPSTFPGAFGGAPSDTGATFNAGSSFTPSPPPPGSGVITVH